jgi:putative endonuclease
MEKRRDIGSRGERAAERHLKREGLVILARNWRGGGGELDLAALEGETLVFVEVKTRSVRRTDERRPVAMAQRRRIAAAARSFRHRYGVPQLAYRFDLIEVDAANGDLRWEKDYHRTGRQPVQEER